MRREDMDGNVFWHAYHCFDYLRQSLLCCGATRRWRVSRMRRVFRERMAWGAGGGGHPYVQEVWGHCGVGGEEAGFECEAYLIEDAFCILAFRICKGRAPQGLSFHWQIFMNSDANMKYG